MDTLVYTPQECWAGFCVRWRNSPPMFLEDLSLTILVACDRQLLDFWWESWWSQLWSGGVRFSTIGLPMFFLNDANHLGVVGDTTESTSKKSPTPSESWWKWPSLKVNSQSTWKDDGPQTKMSHLLQLSIIMGYVGNFQQRHQPRFSIHPWYPWWFGALEMLGKWWPDRSDPKWPRLKTCRSMARQIPSRSNEQKPNAQRVVQGSSS